jgi:flagellar protein FlaG
MIDGLTVNSDNLVINKGGGTSSPPPSSPDVNAKSESEQVAAEVTLSATNEVTAQSNKSVERGSKNQPSDKELEKELTESIDKLNEKLNRLNREVLFKVDKKINKNYISVIDKESKEVIREFPPKEIRNFIARFDEFNEQLNSTTDIKSLIFNLEV